MKSLRHTTALLVLSPLEVLAVKWSELFPDGLNGSTRLKTMEAVSLKSPQATVNYVNEERDLPSEPFGVEIKMVR